MVDGLLGDDEARCDLCVAQAVGEELEEFELAGGQAGGVGFRAWPRSAGYPTSSPLAQPERDDRGGGTGAEFAELVVRAAQRLFVIAVGEGKRGLIPAALRGADLRDPLRFAGDVLAEQLLRAGRRLGQ